jgi:hypothetical protein
MNNSERVYARKLLEMIKSVDTEGSKVMCDLQSDALKEFFKALMWQ